MKKKIKICLIGSWRNYSKEARKGAKLLGEWVAERNHSLVTGACLGIPHEAAKACHKKKGHSIGYSPANSSKYHLKKHGLAKGGFTEIIYMDEKEHLSYSKRNIINIKNSDIVILISGKLGAINEYTIAMDMKKPVFVLEGVGNASDLIRNIEKSLYGKAKSHICTSIKELLIELEKYIVKHFD
jgi:uncharacterized protein (TIGR00725 family)